MDWEIKKDTTSKEVIDKIRLNGFVKFPGYLEDVSGIKGEVEKIIEETVEDDYLFGKAARIGSVDHHQEVNPNIFNFFAQKWMYDLFAMYSGKVANFQEMFVQHDYRNDRGVNRNGELHFDRLWTFKYMLYLTDVDETQGPFCTVPGSHIDGKFLRERTWSDNGSYNKAKNRIFKDYPELGYSEEDIVPITGAAGTLIVFDTDLFHLGGLVQDNKDRILIRSHIRG